MEKCQDVIESGMDQDEAEADVEAFFCPYCGRETSRPGKCEECYEAGCTQGVW